MTVQLIIKNVHYKTSKKIIKDFFKGIKIAYIRDHTKSAKLLEFRNCNVEKALALDKTTLCGKIVRILRYNKEEEAEEEQNGNEKKLFKRKDDDETIDAIISTGRLFVRYLNFEVTEEQIRELFSKYGELVEVKVPFDFIYKKNKGFAFVTFMDGNEAVEAYKNLNGYKLIDRKIHILPGEESETTEKKNDSDEISDNEGEPKKTDYKKEKLKALKSDKSISKWNYLFIHQEAAIKYLSFKTNKDARDLFDATKGSMGVQLAQTQVIIVQEMKQFLENNKVDIQKLEETSRPKERLKTVKEKALFSLSSTSFLVKNLVFGTTEEDLLDLYKQYEGLVSIKLSPYGLMAIITFELAAHAEIAMNKTNYKLFKRKETVIFAQWIPFKVETNEEKLMEQVEVKSKMKRESTDQKDSEEIPAKKLKEDVVITEQNETSDSSPILIVKNINFQTTYENLMQLFGQTDGFKDIRLPKKPDGRHRGFAFLEYNTKEDAETIVNLMSSTHLLGRRLVFEYSKKMIC